MPEEASTEVDTHDRDRQQARLTRTIQAEIIPRLMLAHRMSESAILPGAQTARNPTLADIQEMARLLATHEVSAARRYVDSLCEAGMPLETVFLDLLTGAARLLGLQWEEDQASFADVTIGLSRIQQLVRELGPSFSGGSTSGGRLQAVLAPVPGEQHTLGVHVAEEFFRRAGWEVLCIPDVSESELIGLLQSEPVRLLGLSIGSLDRVARLGQLVAEVRGCTQGRELVVMIGGAATLLKPDLYLTVGADYGAQDARHAVALMELHARTRIS
jgi:methanogenic corrinoid protein MtbC1